MPEPAPARCQWCSAAVPAPAPERCPACGAALAAPGGAEPDVRGVTTLDTDLLLRPRAERPKRTVGLLGFLTGEADPEPSPAEAATFAPPPDEVRREIERLRREALRTDLEAEVAALRSEALALADEVAVAEGAPPLEALPPGAPVTAEPPASAAGVPADDAAGTPDPGSRSATQDGGRRPRRTRGG